jgi:centriole, cilia and spindle-associated protein
MSPGSGVKSEYMKRYREPRWDEYAPCYRELLRYRLGRRLLEQAHAPWLWDAWGPDGASDSSASSSPAPRCASAEPAEPAEPSAPSAREEPEQPAGEPSAEQRGSEAGDAEAGDVEAAAEHDAALAGTGPSSGQALPVLFWI